MKAIVQDRYGDVDVLQLRDIATPAIKEDEVLICVHAAGLDPGRGSASNSTPDRMGAAVRRLLTRECGGDDPPLGQQRTGAVPATVLDALRHRPPDRDPDGGEVIGLVACVGIVPIQHACQVRHAPAVAHSRLAPPAARRSAATVFHPDSAPGHSILPRPLRGLSALPSRGPGIDY